MHIRRDRDALIIIDQQLDFQPGGALAVADGDAVVEPINRMAETFSTVVITQDHHPLGHISFASSYVGREPFSAVTLREAEAGEVEISKQAAFTGDELVDYLRAVPSGLQQLWPDHCVIGSTGEALDPRLEAWRATLLLRKGTRPNADSYSAFRENDGMTTGLAEALMARGVERVYVVGLAGDFCVLFTAIDGVDSGLEVIYLPSLTRFIGPTQPVMQQLEEAGAIVM